MSQRIAPRRGSRRARVRARTSRLVSWPSCSIGLVGQAGARERAGAGVGAAGDGQRVEAAGGPGGVGGGAVVARGVGTAEGFEDGDLAGGKPVLAEEGGDPAGRGGVLAEDEEAGAVGEPGDDLLGRAAVDGEGLHVGEAPAHGGGGELEGGDVGVEGDLLGREHARELGAGGEPEGIAGDEDGGGARAQRADLGDHGAEGAGPEDAFGRRGAARCRGGGRRRSPPRRPRAPHVPRARGRASRRRRCR